MSRKQNSRSISECILVIVASALTLSGLILPVMNPQRISASDTTTITTDYYKATVNTNGTLGFANGDTDATIIY